MRYIISIFILSSLCGVPFFSQELRLPDVVTVVPSTKKEKGSIEISTEQLKKFQGIEQALESNGFSFKNSNSEVTYHGYWNSSIKVYIDDVMMNNPDTGKFDWSAVDYSSVKKIIVDTGAVNGSIGVFIYTQDKDYTKARYAFNAQTKSYLNSIFDSSSVGGSFSIPLELRNGSSLFISENITASHNQNHFAYRSASIDYIPGFSDSYSGYKKNYKGYEKFLLNNSFSFEYSPAALDGCIFGLQNFVSFSDGNCGKTEGYYFSEEKQRDLNVNISIPVFLPLNDLRIKFIPTYKFSDLLYTKDARYSSARDEYKINSCYLQQEISFCSFFTINSLVTYEFSSQTSEQFEGTERNSMFTIFVSPEARFAIDRFNFCFALPVNYFNPSKTFDVLFKVYGEYSFRDFTFSLCASRNATNPVFQQLYYSGSGGKGNPDLTAETAFNFYGSVTYSGLFDVSLRPYIILYKDKIGWQNTGINSWQPLNYGSSRNFGFDLTFSTKDLISHFMLNINYTLCKALLTSDEETKWNQIMFTPVHTLSADFQLTFGDFIWNTLFSFCSEKYLENTNENSLPNFFNVDTKLSWNYRNLRLSLAWNNIFDFQYVASETYPLGGTSITFGILYKK